MAPPIKSTEGITGKWLNAGPHNPILHWPQPIKLLPKTYIAKAKRRRVRALLRK